MNEADFPMRGFPPAASGQVRLANWRSAPFNKWAFQHVRELIPTADIPNDPDSVWELPVEPVDLGDFDAFMTETDTDGLVILHRGRLVYERYANGMSAHTPHILMSVSKSVLGMVAGILIERGVFDRESLVSGFVPELAAGAYRDATLGDLLDMRAGVRFDENYSASAGPIIAYRKAQGWNPLDPGDTPSDLRTFLGTIAEADGPHGGRFHYVSPNTDLLGWIIERATGKRYCDLVSELLWRPLGAERSAYITVDRLGAPRCAGGMCVTARDLARLGQLLVQDGRRGAHGILPAAWMDDVVQNGSAAAWKDGDFAGLFPGRTVHYRGCWYVLHGAAPLLFCLGVNGQHLFVDRENELVIAKLSSQAAPMDKRCISLTMRAVEALRKRLAG